MSEVDGKAKDIAWRIAHIASEGVHEVISDEIHHALTKEERNIIYERALEISNKIFGYIQKIAYKETLAVFKKIHQMRNKGYKNNETQDESGFFEDKQ